MDNQKHKITIVDKDDNVIGATTKEEAFNNGIIRRISRVFLLNAGQIYLQRRGSKMKLFPNTWDQSAGGHVDEGETYTEAAQRELNEELGINNVNLVEIGKFYLEETYNNLATFQFSTVFSAIYAQQSIALQQEEISGGKWFKFEDVNKMVTSNPNDFATGFVVAWKKYKDILE